MTLLARLREALLALAGVTLLAAITAWIVDVPGRLGIALYEEQFLALVLGCSAALLLGQMLRERRWRAVVRGWTLAATVTTMDQREASAAEPLADTVGMRLWGLREAQDMGLARWVSAEPCESPAVARDVILGVAGIVDEVRVGRLHHGGGDPDAAGWRKFREWAERASGSRSLQGTRVVVKRETGG
jgi:hypothetical protein